MEQLHARISMDMPSWHVGYRDATTNAGTRRAGGGAGDTGQDDDRMLGQLPESTRNRSWDDTRMIGLRVQKKLFRDLG